MNGWNFHFSYFFHCLFEAIQCWEHQSPWLHQKCNIHLSESARNKVTATRYILRTIVLMVIFCSNLFPRTFHLNKIVPNCSKWVNSPRVVHAYQTTCCEHVNELIGFNCLFLQMPYLLLLLLLIPLHQPSARRSSPVQMYFSSEVRAGCCLRTFVGELYLFLEKVKSGASIRITNSLGLMVPLAAWSEWVGSKDVRGWMTSTLLGCCYDIHPVLWTE